MANVGKVCCVCKEEKQHSEFYKNKHKPLGLTYECKECVKARSLLRDKEKNKESCRKYYQKNKEVWYRNRPLRAHHQAKRRAVKLNATPSWLSDRQKEEIQNLYWLAQDLRIVTGEDYHVDHIIPIQGKTVCGLHVPWNLQILPADVNFAKGNKLL